MVKSIICEICDILSTSFKNLLQMLNKYKNYKTLQN